MLLFQTILLASLSSGSPVVPVAHANARPTPLWVTRLLSLRTWQKKLRLSVPCSSLLSGGVGPCVSLVPEPALLERVPAGDAPGTLGFKLPRRNDAFRTQGGFVHLDVVDAPSLRMGPELSWSTPDSPREDLMKVRLLSPGWGVRFAFEDTPVSVGVSACSRVMMMGKELPLVDPFTSEARVEFRLP
ncbi:MAG TPA: hypothetical protein VMG12_13575 [Polyangiaceae bacterium]|nr:hypothetical protein [Polyangiaceae bacterium]